MKIRNGVTRFVALGAFVVGTVFAAAPASAAPLPNWECGAWDFCIYHGENGESPRLEMEVGVYDLGGVAGGRLNDHVFSARNISGRNWCLFEHAGYNNQIDLIPDGFQGKIGDHIRGRVSSVRSC